MTIKLGFADFWDGFQHNNNFFLDLFTEIYGDVQLVPAAAANILIYSCFGQSHQYMDRKKCIKIFYTGENLRPNYSECDYSFSFDFDDYNGKNIRIPLWMLQIDWFNKVTYKNPNYVLPLDDINDNSYIKTPKSKFCAAIFNNPEKQRVEAYEKLSSYKKVDGYGKPFSNWFYGEEVKYRILAHYKFSLCFENSSYPGYYTEKLFHAKTAGTLPIYWSDKEIDKDFNAKSYIHLANFNSISDMVEYVSEVDANDGLYRAYCDQPLFDAAPSLEPIKKQIKDLLRGKI